MRIVFFLIILKLYYLNCKFFSCETSVDCSLNGECVNLKCICDRGWKGKSCNKLNLDLFDYNHGYRNTTESSWGGNSIFEDGKWHLFVAQMKYSCPLANWGTNSEIIRAESDNPEGPYHYVETILPAFAHNPTIRKTNSNEFVIYYIGGTTTPVDCRNQSFDYLFKKYNSKYNENTGIFMAYSKSIYGPWETFPLEINNTHQSILNCSYTNPTALFEKNSSKVYFSYQAGSCGSSIWYSNLGVAVADSWRGPYSIVTFSPILPKPFICLGDEQYEDPFLYKNKRGFHLIIHGMCPSGFWNSAHAYSLDGINWKLSDSMPYNYFIHYKQGGFNLFFRMERPQLIIDDEGNPLYLINGVEEWIKRSSYTTIVKILN